MKIHVVGLTPEQAFPPEMDFVEDENTDAVLRGAKDGELVVLTVEAFRSFAANGSGLRPGTDRFLRGTLERVARNNSVVRQLIAAGGTRA